MEHNLDKINQLISEIEKVILGKREVIQLTVTALLAGGHVLFEDIPGVGKTTMVKTLAKAIQGKFSRVQFTPDLLPSDILGISIYIPQNNLFEFRPGPIFTTLLLADEINRTTPRTQAALLEAMSEGHVTIDSETYQLDPHFFVLATQNPNDFEGTYPLPESQLDRFLFRLQIGYPAFDEELKLITGASEAQSGMSFASQKRLETVQTILSPDELAGLKKAVDETYIDEQVASYALKLVQASREHNAIELGVSPRGGIAFVRGAKAFALTQGRTFVTPQDLQHILPYVFGHRLLLKGGFHTSQEALGDVLEEIIQQVPIPIRR